MFPSRFLDNCWSDRESAIELLRVLADSAIRDAGLLASEFSGPPEPDEDSLLRWFRCASEYLYYTVLVVSLRSHSDYGPTVGQDVEDIYMLCLMTNFVGAIFGSDRVLSEEAMKGFLTCNSVRQIEYHDVARGARPQGPSVRALVAGRLTENILVSAGLSMTDGTDADFAAMFQRIGASVMSSVMRFQDDLRITRAKLANVIA